MLPSKYTNALVSTTASTQLARSPKPCISHPRKGIVHVGPDKLRFILVVELERVAFVGTKERQGQAVVVGKCEVMNMLSVLKTTAAVAYMGVLLVCITKARSVIINAAADAISHGHCMWL